MNPEFPQNEREATEAKLTALLLGELPADEIPALSRAMEQDPELAALYDQLKLTIGLVREGVAQTSVGADAQAPALKMSPDRREKLLGQFKTVTPKEFSRPRRLMDWLAPAAAVAAIVVVLWSMFMPALSKSKQRAIRLVELQKAKESAAKSSRTLETDNDGIFPVRTASPAAAPRAPQGTKQLLEDRISDKRADELGRPAVSPSSPVRWAAPAPRKEAEKKAAASAAPVPPAPEPIILNADHATEEAIMRVTKNLDKPSILGADSFDTAVDDKAATATWALRSDQTTGELKDSPGDRGILLNDQVTTLSGRLSPSGTVTAIDLQGGNSFQVTNAVVAAGTISQNSWSSFDGSTDAPVFLAGNEGENKSEFNKGFNFDTGTTRSDVAPADSDGFITSGLRHSGVKDESGLKFNDSTDAPVVLAGNDSEYRRNAPVVYYSLDDSSSNDGGHGAVGGRGGFGGGGGGFGGAGDAAVAAAEKLQSQAQNRGEIAPAQSNATPTPRLGGSAVQDQNGTTLNFAGGVTTTAAESEVQTLRAFPSQATQANGVIARYAEVIVPDPALPKAPLPALIPQPEILTRENAFSTFSLNVSDVSFKLAAASLEKGQLPEPASIRSEEFINAFDYRDPDARPGVPIAFAAERARYPFAHNRELLRLSLKTGATGRQAGRPLNIVLLLDNSGSMERADRVRIIQEALRVLAGQLHAGDTFSIVTFARTAQLRVDGIRGDQAASAAAEIAKLTPEGGTNLGEALNLAYETARHHYLANGDNRVVLLTDGAANLGDVQPEVLKQKVETQRRQGIALDAFGIGWEGYNDDLLEALTRNGDGRYGFINTPEAARTDFAAQIAGALHVAASDVKVQVEFNPKRVTSYRQIGYAKHQLTKQQFRDNTVDAAEIAAQEAGNALYTMEINAAGEGSIGTVRVRYKVPGTTEYREQAWDVPYTGGAVAMDQASSAMRLASTAGAFSEWLATSPFAAEVSPDQLLKYLAGVPQVYGADTRPAKLESMIREARSISGK